MQLQRVIISGGGTGGHIFPAIAIANAIKELSPGVEILFVGANGKMEMEKVPAAGYKIEGLNIAGLQRSLSLKNILLPFKVVGAVWKAKSIIKKFDPQVAIGVGGYASAALIYAAGKKGIPVLIQEQNSFPGKTNKFLSKYASKICVAYPEMQQFFAQEKIVFTGNPVRQEIEKSELTRKQGLDFLGLQAENPVLLSFGGSQGAKAINEGIENALPLFQQHGIQVIWQTGKFYFERAKKAVAEGNYANVKVFEFIEKMNYAYAAADLVVSRAGAIAVAELQIKQKASILIPLPTAAEDHQTKNAMALVNRNAALIIHNNEAPAQIGNVVLDAFKDEDKVRKLENNIQQLAKYDAARIIASEVLNLVKK